MKKILNITTVYILCCIGLIMIFTGLLLEINNLNKQVKEHSEFINVQGNQINKCNAENSSLYKNYLELEEKNMVLEAKNKIYEKESETKGNN